MSAPVTPEQLAEWRQLAGAATPGPWRSWGDGHVGGPAHPGGVVMPTVGSALLQQAPDAKFIAAAREAVPALLDEADRLRRLHQGQADHIVALRTGLDEQTERADHEDRCAVQATRAADRWHSEYKRVVAEKEAALVEMQRLRDNPVARRMKAERDEARAEVEHQAEVIARVRALIDNPKDAHYPIVERAEVRGRLDGEQGGDDRG